jgi:hypothetical protein
MSELYSPTLAPLVSDIINDPAELADHASHPVYVLRESTDLPAGKQQWLEATTEADALRDLNAHLDDTIQTLRGRDWLEAPFHLHFAQALQERLRFMGAKARATGERAIAGRWLELLQSSPDGELHVSVPAFESGGLIYQGVLGQLGLTNPDTIDAIHPFDPAHEADARTWDRRRRNGVVMVDDWIMTGLQVEKQISNFVRQGLSTDNIEAHYLCASEPFITEGIIGVRALSRYTYKGLRHQDGLGRASVFGSHAVPDNGFQNELRRINDYMQSIGVNAGLPLFYEVAKAYKWPDFQDLPRRGDPEQYAALDATVAACQQNARRLAIANTL